MLKNEEFDNCKNINGTDESYSIIPYVYNLFPNLKSIVFFITGYTASPRKYHFYRMSFTDLLAAKDTNVIITIKAEHKCHVEFTNDKGMIHRKHICESWLSEAYKSMSESHGKRYGIFYQKAKVYYPYNPVDVYMDIIQIRSAQDCI